MKPLKRATLADVATEVGLSPSTVSRALDPAKSSIVNPKTRERVIAAAELLGYRPDMQARSLMTGRTQTIGVIAADLGNRWVTPILHGVASRVSVEGIVPIIAETNDDSGVLADILDLMIGRRVDALIVLAARRPDARAIESAARIVPVVVAARPLADVSVPVVTHDDRHGGRMVAKHFAELGHTLTTQLCGPTEVRNFELRKQGFSGVAKRRGMRQISLRDEAAVPSFEEGARLMRLLLDGGDELPTAIFAGNDPMAIGAISVIRERGLRIPQDVSIAGYNDMPLTDMLSPGLTTVRYPGREVGREAADVALRLIEGDRTVESVCLDPVLVRRGSTAPPMARNSPDAKGR